MSHNTARVFKAGVMGLTGGGLLGYKYLQNTAGSGSDPNMASNLRAQIAREQWADYKARFQPKENQLLGIANDPQGFIQQENAKALSGINQGYANAMPQMQREYSRFGMQYTPDQTAELQRRLNLNQGLATVQGLNTSTRTANQQVLNVLGGGMFQGQQPQGKG